MSVLFISGLDVPNCFKDFLWLTTVGVSKSVYAVSNFFWKQCDARFPQLVLHSALVIVATLICHIDYVPILYVIITVCVVRIYIQIFTVIVSRFPWCCDLVVFQAVIKILSVLCFIMCCIRLNQ